MFGIRVLQFSLFIAFGWLIVTQMAIPQARAMPWFPAFRKKRTHASEELEAARETAEVENIRRETRKEIAQAKKIRNK